MRRFCGVDIPFPQLPFFKPSLWRIKRIVMNRIIRTTCCVFRHLENVSARRVCPLVPPAVVRVSRISQISHRTIVLDQYIENREESKRVCSVSHWVDAHSRSTCNREMSPSKLIPNHNCPCHVRCQCALCCAWISPLVTQKYKNANIHPRGTASPLRCSQIQSAVFLSFNVRRRDIENPFPFNCP